MNPCVLADTSFPGWRSARLSDPGATTNKPHPRFKSSTTPNWKNSLSTPFNYLHCLDTEVNNLNVNWIDRSKKTLDQLKELKDKPDQDRLDLVKNMRYAFSALGQSLSGWMQWVNSPEIMAQFTQEELKEMSTTLIDMISQFVEYDLDITDVGMQKGVGKQREEQGNRFVI